MANITHQYTRYLSERDRWEIMKDEHDSTLNAKRVNVVGGNFTIDAPNINIGDVGLVDEDENPYNVQNPIPADGDSIYEKDIDITNSDIGGFSGSVEELFNNYNTEISDTSATNPKIIKIRFKRPVSSNALGMGSKTGDFSNVKILLKDLAGTTRVTLDKSADNTKYTSNVYNFTHSEFIEAEIQFHTTDPITLNGSFIPKQGHVVAVISGINDVTGLAEQVKVDNGELIVGGKIGLKNTSNTNINPATEEKQDSIITALGGTVDTLTPRYHAHSTNPNIAYSGNAVVASSEADAVWQIQELDFTDGDIVVKFADGNDDFDNIYNNREALSYS